MGVQLRCTSEPVTSDRSLLRRAPFPRKFGATIHVAAFRRQPWARLTPFEQLFMTIEEGVALAPLTTMQIGGRARFFCVCATPEEIRQGLEWAREQQVPVHVLGGGSNTIFSDDGFDGLVLHIRLNGVQRERQGDSELVTAGAGEDWDALVAGCIDGDLSGIECLSGIPGSVGASPMQNVGAYGQEVSQTIVLVRALEQATLRPVEFANEECGFAYRQSRFKREDRGRFIVTEVVFQAAQIGKTGVALRRAAQPSRGRRCRAGGSCPPAARLPTRCGRPCWHCGAASPWCWTRQTRMPVRWALSFSTRCCPKRPSSSFRTVGVSREEGRAQYRRLPERAARKCRRRGW